MGNRSGKMNAKVYALTRRQILKAGGVLVPAAALAPGIFSRSALAQSATTFDYYISPSGSNSNAGTLSSPWAITAINSKQAIYAGKRVGFLPGTYDVSALMTTDSSNGARTPVMNINGGTGNSARTYLASCDSSGNYSPRTVTFDAKGASGQFGGGTSTTNAIMGCNNQVANGGYWTVDGFRFTGFSLWAFHVGSSPSGGMPIHDWTVQNCEFFGGSGQNATNASGVNLAPFIIYTASNGLITNNYFHDNRGWTDTEHFSCFYQWGLTNPTSGIVYTYNTLIATGNIHSKEATQYNCELAYNYIDMTGTTPTPVYSQTAACIAGFGADGGKGTLTKIHNNILISPYMEYLALTNDTGQNGWYTRCQVYNNTFVASGNQYAGGSCGVEIFEMTAGSRIFSFWNNLFYDGSYTSAANYGYIMTNTDAFSLANYNIYGGHNHYTLVPAGVQTDASLTQYSTLLSYQTASGIDVNSSSTTANPFTNNGPLARQYQVEAGSPAYQMGRVGGVSGGSICNVGAWDGTATQVGCDFASGQVLPDPPSLNSVS